MTHTTRARSKKNKIALLCFNFWHMVLYFVKIVLYIYMSVELEWMFHVVCLRYNLYTNQRAATMRLYSYKLLSLYRETSETKTFSDECKPHAP